MRILAALTLLISVLLSPLSTAAPLELKWSVDVDESILGRAELRYMGPMVPTHGGGCIGRAHIALDGVNTTLLYAIGTSGQIRWTSSLGIGSFFVVSSDCVVFSSAEGYMSVDLNSGEVTLVKGNVRGEIFATHGKGNADDPTIRRAGIGLPLTNAHERFPPDRPVIQMWAPASPTPNLAPSTFGLEDGNLIISWPTAAGQTYQVQRSTDLESWENIVVAPSPASGSVVGLGHHEIPFCIPCSLALQTGGALRRRFR